MTEKQDRFSHAVEQCRRAYRDTPIPPELEGAVEDAIQTGCRSRPPRRGLKRAAAAAAGLCACFVVLTSPAVAAAVENVPVLGALSRILTGQAYESREEASYVQVKLPKIEHTGDSSLEQRVNMEISAALKQEVEESKQRAKEYYQAYVETGGDPAEYNPILIQVDYEVKSVTDQWVSFGITKTETMASAYTQFYFYNLDLETGRELTLRDLLGPDYAAIAAQRIRQELDSWSEEERMQLFDGVDLESLIGEDRGFYIREDGTVMVVFEKYEIAVGAAGNLEFPVGTLA